jgi:hypothetical protein
MRFAVFGAAQPDVGTSPLLPDSSVLFCMTEQPMDVERRCAR